MISCLNKHFVCYVECNEIEGRHYEFWVLSFIKTQKVTIKIFFKRHRSFAIMTFVNFFYLFSTD